MNCEHITEKWSEKYPNAMKQWERDWCVISPICKFSADVRTVRHKSYHRKSFLQKFLHTLASALRRPASGSPLV